MDKRLASELDEDLKEYRRLRDLRERQLNVMKNRGDKSALQDGIAVLNQGTLAGQYLGMPETHIEIMDKIYTQ